MSIIYQSSRCFWKQRCNLDIALVEHPVINVLEVISYDSKLNVEAPRMYVDHFLIKATIHQEELDKRLLELKEPFLRRRQTFDEQQLIKTAMNDAVASLIVGQLTIKEYCAEMRTLLLEFGQSVANFVCECPAGLIPFQIEHRPPVS